MNAAVIVGNYLSAKNPLQNEKNKNPKLKTVPVRVSFHKFSSQYKSNCKIKHLHTEETL